jgi:hypothetical protein
LKLCTPHFFDQLHVEFANATLMRTNYSDTASLALLLEKLTEARPILVLYWTIASVSNRYG